jgi:hypothetical protein
MRGFIALEAGARDCRGGDRTGAVALVVAGEVAAGGAEHRARSTPPAAAKGALGRVIVVTASGIGEHQRPER